MKEDEFMNDYIIPSLNGEKCLANGQHPEHECECDECEHFLECFQILIDRNTSSTPNGFILGIAGQGGKIEIKESDIIDNTADAVDEPITFSFSEEEIETRKNMMFPSGIEISRNSELDQIYFTKEIENVCRNTKDRIFILDTCIPQIHTVSIGDVEVEPERIMRFTINDITDAETELFRTFLTATAFARTDRKLVWMFIPSPLIAAVSPDVLFTIMKRSRKAGVIITVAISATDIKNNEILQFLSDALYYHALYTDNTESYKCFDTISADKIVAMNLNAENELHFDCERIKRIGDYDEIEFLDKVFDISKNSISFSDKRDSISKEVENAIKKRVETK